MIVIKENQNDENKYFLRTKERADVFKTNRVSNPSERQISRTAQGYINADLNEDIIDAKLVENGAVSERITSANTLQGNESTTVNPSFNIRGITNKL